MVRFLLAVILITLLITYAVVPAVKNIRKIFNKEVNRIDKTFQTVELEETKHE